MKPSFFLALCAVAALAPLVNAPRPAGKVDCPPWPDAYEGVPLRPVALSPAEESFHASFPGAVARFTDGRREFIFRWVTTATRRLHPGADCFRGLGYTVESAPPMLDSRGERWRCFSAVHGDRRLLVRERIVSSTQPKSWTDVSAWYWSAMLHPAEGPWLATTIGEPSE